jgi:hypothetical protein
VAIEKFVKDTREVIAVDGATLRFMLGAALEAPRAAGLLMQVPAERRVQAVEELLEFGAQVAATAQTSAQVVMIEGKIDQLVLRLTHDLGAQLTQAGDRDLKKTEQVLQDFQRSLVKTLSPLSDPDNRSGLPAKMVELLEQSHRTAMKSIAGMLEDPDQGTIGRATKTIVEQMKAIGHDLSQQLAARDALLKRSVLRGGRFEDVLAARLPILARPIGRVEHCGATAGSKARNFGDYILTLDGLVEGHEIRVAVEAKAQKKRLSAELIRQQLKAARLNRNAVVGLFIAEDSEILPRGIGFGQVSDCDFYVAFNPEEADDTLLSCAIWMARAAALATVKVERGDQFNLAAVTHEIVVIRTLTEHFSKIETSHSKIDREVAVARNAAADIKADILAALRRLESYLNS